MQRPCGIKEFGMFRNKVANVIGAQWIQRGELGSKIYSCPISHPPFSPAPLYPP